ncbi:hypothetical protein DSCA_22880 [Desulfosarcina alkanivorans]|uniref:Exosortase H n=1 Tax=Desulfosarcina alkanivorans TaxID=571177 RepID=A0A5K7YH36_9BACT|nr:archaeosortase/exosortase family protein [Desulfosarcina alkanivorans]BBO68358.1 hypothetical protein DSCA_22880 [Desulfosarcina alkanivorans]
MSAGAGRRAVGRRSLLLPFTRKFLLATVVGILAVSLVPETVFQPLNRLTALLVGDLIRLTGLEPVVRGTRISTGGFSVNVIAECSAVQLMVLYAAFTAAFPAPRAGKWIGWAAGTVLLFTVNIIRIAAVTLVGRQFPDWFETAHVYFGQLGMLVATIAVCLLWCRWQSHADRLNGPAAFCLRFLIFSSLPFLFWIHLNRLYVGAIDTLIGAFFRLNGLQLVIPRTHHLYYQTFSLIALGGLLMAVRGAGPVMRLRWLALGLVALTLFQAAFRLCNVWITAFGFEWLAPLSQLVYNICVRALPLAVALGFLVNVRGQREPAG